MPSQTQKSGVWINGEEVSDQLHWKESQMGERDARIQSDKKGHGRGLLDEAYLMD
jgi:hypothetical protein